MQNESKARCHIPSAEIQRVQQGQSPQRNGRSSRTENETPGSTAGPREFQGAAHVPQTPFTPDLGTFGAASADTDVSERMGGKDLTDTALAEELAEMFQKLTAGGTSEKSATLGKTERRRRRDSRAPLTREEKHQAALLISYGHSLRQAASQIGRSHMTLSRYMKNDPEFAEQVERYRGYAESDAMAEVVKASRRSWRAAAWLLTYLERRERRQDRRSGAA